MVYPHLIFSSFFFFNDTATTEIYTLSLHDALPISSAQSTASGTGARWRSAPGRRCGWGSPDRKSTRLNSSHLVISYAVFCLKKKNGLQDHVIDPDPCYERQQPWPSTSTATGHA